MDAMKVPSFTMMPGMFFFKKGFKIIEIISIPFGHCLEENP
jgi:hypothetical protein